MEDSSKLHKKNQTQNEFNNSILFCKNFNKNGNMKKGE